MPFSYRPLNVEAHEVRALDVSFEKGTISCTVHHISLDTEPAPEYEAISYCWGDPDPCSQILLEGHHFPVPANTELALRRMIAGHESRVLWIDAVCINQGDVDERESQVALMAKIYSLSRRTLVHLGEAGAYRRRIVDVVDMNADHTILRAMENIAALQHDIRGELGENPSVDAMQTRALQPPRTRFDEISLTAFFSLPWFK